MRCVAEAEKFAVVAEHARIAARLAFEADRLAKVVLNVLKTFNDALERCGIGSLEVGVQPALPKLRCGWIGFSERPQGTSDHPRRKGKAVPDDRLLGGRTIGDLVPWRSTAQRRGATCGP